MRLARDVVVTRYHIHRRLRPTVVDIRQNATHGACMERSVRLQRIMSVHVNKLFLLEDLTRVKCHRRWAIICDNMI